jgi:hypothetical protein
MTEFKIHKMALISLLILMICCADDSNDIEPRDDSNGKLPFHELFAQGIDRYLGVFSPSSVDTISPGVLQYQFSGLDNPICFTGNQFTMFTRDGSNNNLFIFLQGGGFCSPTTCAALETGLPLQPIGILDPDDAQNPLKSYNLGYAPYCDGSLWMGDNEVDSDGDGTNDRYFRGLQNLSASLDVIAKAYPNPGHIVLAGISAGGFGVHPALPLVRKLFPSIRIYVINDSGIGIFNPGQFNDLLNYWKAHDFIPSSCQDCVGSDGNLTKYHRYQLKQDQQVKMAFISSKQDSIASSRIGGLSFETQVLESVNELQREFPDRFQSLIANGEAHAYLIGRYDNQIGGVNIKDWIESMLAERNRWVSITE